MQLIESINQNFSEYVPKALNIYRYPDKILFTKSELLTLSIPDDTDLQELLEDMVYTLRINRLIGLSAVQVGVPVQAFVVQDENQEPIKIVNPIIKEIDGQSYSIEGCASFPGVFTRILRAEEVVLSYFNEKGEAKTSVFTGLLARAVDHECEHLEGKTFLDKMNSVQRQSVLKKIRTINRKIAHLK